jgi:hypothetical protein
MDASQFCGAKEREYSAAISSGWRGKVCEAVGHSHHIPVTPEIELIHLSDVPIFEPA